MPAPDKSAPKRPVNLTLNEDLVARARQTTGNLSGVVEAHLAEDVERAWAARGLKVQEVRKTVAIWTAHGAEHGSIANEYSPL